MTVELAAVRLLAPWFGTSQTVWTNVIGVILLSLSLGYAWGGRLTSRAVPVRALGFVLTLAGAWVLWLPWLGPTVARLLVPEGLALHEVAVLIGWGSLAVSSLTFLPPAAMLGTVCPLVLEGLARARGLSAGRAGGAVLFASTAGSLVGVFGTTNLLIPELGLRWTFWIAGGLLFACGMLARALVPRPERIPQPSGSLLLLLLAAGAPFAPVQGARLKAGQRELARRESPYQSVRVIEDATLVPPLRYLQVNEGLDSFQSVWQPAEGLLPEGFYYNDFLLPSCWDPSPDPWRVLVLGLGAGSVVRVFATGDWPRATFVGVEIDPVVVELGTEYFDLDETAGRLEVHSGMDARVALRALRLTFDQIVIDCYANQFEIPAHLCTREFFLEAYSRLRSGGWLTANLGGFGFGDPVVEQVSSTCAAAFGSPVVIVRVPMSRNYILLARRDEPVPWMDSGLRPPSAAARVLPLGARRLQRFSRLIEPRADDVLRDDLCPIEKLQRRSLREARSRRTEVDDT